MNQQQTPEKQTLSSSSFSVRMSTNGAQQHVAHHHQNTQPPAPPLMAPPQLPSMPPPPTTLVAPATSAATTTLNASSSANIKKDTPLILPKRRSPTNNNASAAMLLHPAHSTTPPPPQLPPPPSNPLLNASTLAFLQPPATTTPGGGGADAATMATATTTINTIPMAAPSLATSTPFPPPTLPPPNFPFLAAANPSAAPPTTAGAVSMDLVATPTPQSLNPLVTATPPGTNSGNSPLFFRNRKLRSGKWTREEEAYAERLIELFEKGCVFETDNLELGVTLRSYLSQKLHCAPMRISKKFAGQGIGKLVYKKGTTPINPEQLQRMHEATQQAEQSFYKAVSVDVDFMSQQPFWGMGAPPGLLVPMMHAAATTTTALHHHHAPFVLPSSMLMATPAPTAPGGMVLVPPGAPLPAPAALPAPLPAPPPPTALVCLPQPVAPQQQQTAVAPLAPASHPAPAPPVIASGAHTLHAAPPILAVSESVTTAASVATATTSAPVPSADTSNIAAQTPVQPCTVTTRSSNDQLLRESYMKAMRNHPCSSSSEKEGGQAQLPRRSGSLVSLAGAAAPQDVKQPAAPGNNPPIQGDAHEPQAVVGTEPAALPAALQPPPGPLPPPFKLPTTSNPATSEASSRHATAVESSAMPQPSMAAASGSAGKEEDGTAAHAADDDHEMPDFLSGFDRVALRLKAAAAPASTDCAAPAVELQCSPPFTSRSFDDFHQFLGNAADLVPLDESAHVNNDEAAKPAMTCSIGPPSSSDKHVPPLAASLLFQERPEPAPPPAPLLVSSSSASAHGVEQTTAAPQPKADDGGGNAVGAGFDTNALFSAESYAVFAQESAMAASQHAAYFLSQQQKHLQLGTSHGGAEGNKGIAAKATTLSELDTKENRKRAHSFDMEGMVKLVSRVMPAPVQQTAAGNESDGHKPATQQEAVRGNQLNSHIESVGHTTGNGGSHVAEPFAEAVCEEGREGAKEHGPGHAVQPNKRKRAVVMPQQQQPANLDSVLEESGQLGRGNGGGAAVVSETSATERASSTSEESASSGTDSSQHDDDGDVSSAVSSSFADVSPNSVPAVADASEAGELPSWHHMAAALPRGSPSSSGS